MIVAREYRPGKWSAEAYADSKPLRHRAPSVAEASLMLVTGESEGEVRAEMRRLYGK